MSDSIRSSLSSEELEWHYEQYENYILLNRPSFIQEVNARDFDDTEDCQSEDSNVEGNILNINHSSIFLCDISCNIVNDICFKYIKFTTSNNICIFFSIFVSQSSTILQKVLFTKDLIEGIHSILSASQIKL